MRKKKNKKCGFNETGKRNCMTTLQNGYVQKVYKLFGWAQSGVGGIGVRTSLKNWRFDDLVGLRCLTKIPTQVLISESKINIAKSKLSHSAHFPIVIRKIIKMEKNEVKAYFCPRCKSTKVKPIQGWRNAFGIIQRWHCDNCSFENMTFPIMVMHKSKVKRKK